MQTSSWKIFVRAKANHFNFTLRFRAAGFGPNWTLRRFSFILKFRKFFVFRLNSHPPVPRWRLGLRRVIHKFQSPITRAASGNGGWNDQQTKDLILSGFWLLLAFLAQLQLILRKYWKGVFIILLACVGILGVLLMNKGKRTKLVKVRGLRNCMATIAACSLLFMLGSYGDRMGIMYVAKQVSELIS
ncbi:hypothetical protein QN277_010714 [Acacia crassicarpa]|uniref:Uncharacterized protein n=1 Tax=Acacia crassicarpa TaxID=499986 RepID=A0AAE1INC8_9FABA|nr:hypothetical protein QN277_010714 [Acacia crassicarpa]